MQEISVEGWVVLRSSGCLGKVKDKLVRFDLYVYNNMLNGSILFCTNANVTSKSEGQCHWQTMGMNHSHFLEVRLSSLSKSVALHKY